jgi:hypothetical protein
MPRSDPLTQRIVTSVTQNAHLIQRPGAVREGEREPVHNDHPGTRLLVAYAGLTGSTAKGIALQK